MHTSLALTVLAAATLTVSAHAGDFERTLPANAQVDLYVSTGSGHIHIYSGSDTEVHIKAHVYAGWNAGGNAEERIHKISADPPIQQNGNEIHVGDAPAQDRSLYNNITIDYEISGPKTAALNLRSGSGDVQVDTLGRFIKAQTGSGSIRARGVGGPATLQTGSGDIELQQEAPGEVHASTGSGSIRINGMSGALTARTGSGDIEANGALTGPSRLQTGSGSIRAHLGPESHLNVSADTGSGSIRVAGTSPSSSERHHFSAVIGGGGAALEAHTGSGDIEIN
jgi:hypothetical protein